VTLSLDGRLPATLLSGERWEASREHFQDITATHLHATPRCIGDSRLCVELTAPPNTTPPAPLARSQLRVTLT